MLGGRELAGLFSVTVTVMVPEARNRMGANVKKEAEESSAVQSMTLQPKIQFDVSRKNVLHGGREWW